jgi:outer membrane murein-binding lipoprotein Lpp
MNRNFAIVVFTTLASAALAGCGLTHGVTDTSPKLSSQTTKDVKAYVACLQPKWTALTADVKASSKDDEGRVEARDSKSDARERVDVTASGSGAAVVMHETQSGTYDSRYRDEAISCL